MSVMPISKPALRARFWELTDAKEAATERDQPLWDQRAALLVEMQPLEARLREINQDIKADRPARVEIDEEMALISRALGGKVGPRPGE